MQNFPHTPRRPSNSTSLTSSFIPSARKSSNSSLKKLSHQNSNHSLSSSANSSSQPTPSPSSSAFRSIRSLLPFGQGKASSSQQHRDTGRVLADESGSGSFFGSVKRSMSKDARRDSSVGARPTTETPVISIHASSSTQLDDTMKPYRTESSTNNASLGVPRFDEFGVIMELSSSPDVPVRLPSPSLGLDLSTILEADTSGTSLLKHIPGKAQDQESFEVDGDDDPTVSMPLLKPSQTKPLPSPLFRLPTPSRSREQIVTPESPAPLDFSEIPNQVRDALQQNRHQKAMVSEWLNDTNSILDQEPEEDFDLEALDPDLARILGPNPKSPIDPGSSMPTGSSNGRVIGPQSTPSRRSLSTSIPKPTSSLPRLRSPNPYTTPTISKTGPSPSQSDTSFVLEDLSDSSMARRASLDSHPTRRRSIAPPSPLSTSSSPRQPDSLRKSSITARLTTPRNLSLRRPNWNHLLPHASSSAIDVSQLDRSPTSVIERAATDIDGYTDADLSDLALRNRVFLQDAAFNNRTRKRSASVDQRANGKRPSVYLLPSLPRGSLDRPGRVSSESGRPTAEWLGPRTAKAFAAAGLLDTEKQRTPRLHRGSESSSVSPAARYASARNIGERAHGGGSQYSPSRSSDDVVSRPGSTMSWSRTNMSSLHSHGLMESPTLTNTTPRTNFSGSTAPTSIISPSPTTEYHEIQQLRDKHAMETEALFSALSDAQRQTKLLREENSQLRTRIALLEDEVDSGRKLLDGYRKSVAPPVQRRYDTLEPPDTLIPRRSLDFNNNHLQTVQRPRGASMQIASQSRPASARFLPPSEDRNLPRPETSFTSTTTHRRRGSTTSSVFPTIPSNMTMLVNTGLDISSSFQQPPREADRTSPANFSTTTMEGSPKSLNLRPEHEEHLGDMDDLSLSMSFRDDRTEAGGSMAGSGWS